MWFIKIGSTVRGPFDEEQLRLMIARREFSSVHLVSPDKQHWESAAPLVAMLEGRAKAEPDSKSTNEEWYFSEKGEKRGPLSLKEMRQMIGQGTIKPQTNVFAPGSKAWVRADSQTRLNHLFNKSAIWRKLGIALICAVGIAGITWAIIRFPMASAGVDENLLRKSVGRVQFIEEHHLKNGSIVEIPKSHGTGFCITESGYFLTNRHVVADYKEGMQKSPLGPDCEMKTKTAIYLGNDDRLTPANRFEAEVIFVSKKFDLAILKLNRNKKMHPLTLLTVTEPKLTTEVIAVGFPEVATMDFENQVGVKDAGLKEVKKAQKEKSRVYADAFLVDSELELSLASGGISKKSKSRLGRFVFHSATIFGGNSGGPLIDSNGHVLAINTQYKTDLEDLKVRQDDGKVINTKVNSGKLNVAYLVHQFRAEIEEHIPAEELNWK